jgi:hypothetical protein
VSDAIGRKIGVFKGKCVLLYDLFIMLSIHTQNLLRSYCFFFRIMLFSCIMFLATCFMYFLCTGGVLVIGLLAVVSAR